VKKAVRTTLGVSLLVAGVIGTLLPVVPGIPLFLAGAAVLGPDHRLVRPLTAWLKRRGWSGRARR
jgi:uncharacterized membrane protein YbaN (DUF454 family)